MTHALRQNCGSFLYDSISRDWLSEEEKRALEVGNRSSDLVSSGTVKSLAMSDVEESVSILPAQWPLFDAPVLSSIRVTGFEEKNGITVSLQKSSKGWNNKTNSYTPCTYNLS